MMVFKGLPQRMSGSPPPKIMKGAGKVKVQLGQGTHALVDNWLFLVDCFQDQNLALLRGPEEEGGN